MGSEIGSTATGKSLSAMRLTSTGLEFSLAGPIRGS
jgi:hypothetical protein